MADTGWVSPGTVVEDTSYGAVHWSNLSNITTSNNSYADFYPGSGQDLSYYIKPTNFGFSIPSGATINGIEVRIERKQSAFPDYYAYDSRLRIVKSDGTISTTDRADTSTGWTTGDTQIVYGSSSDLWGETWSYTDINDADFGVAFSVQGSYIPAVNAFVDAIDIKVYYTEGSTTYTSPFPAFRA